MQYLSKGAPRLLPVLVFTLALLPVIFAPVEGRAGFAEMAEEVADIDERMSGNLGVYIKRLRDGREIEHRADREWYLASTIKIPLAVAVLQRVEAGELPLTRELELARSDYVDGTGELLFAEPGTRYTIAELLEHSVEHSDSTATDMLIRLLGEESFNRQLRERIAPEGFGHITTILQVRHDAYGEVHASAGQLDNMDFIELKKASDYSQRYNRLLDKLGIDADDARASSLIEAFERYYRRGLNTGELAAMGSVLERLVDGELLNADNTERLLGHMKNVTTGDQRIKAGLPEDAVFAHKTGTQINRACNVGVLNPHHPRAAIVVAACAEGHDRISEAEQAFARLGSVLSDAGLVR